MLDHVYVAIRSLASLMPLILAALVLGAISVVTNRVRFRRGRRHSNSGRRNKSLPTVKSTSFTLDHKSNFASRKLLNASEKRFFAMLLNAMPECYVFPQVSFNALMTHSSWIKRLHWERFVRRQFNTKYVDFVLCRNSDLEVIAIVEYDGGGHRTHDDAHRDQLLVNTGYRVERFVDSVTSECIKMRFDDLLPITPTDPW